MRLARQLFPQSFHQRQLVVDRLMRDRNTGAVIAILSAIRSPERRMKEQHSNDL